MTETWIQVLTIIALNLIIMLTLFCVIISLHNGMRDEVRAINQEMKDFHGKLEKIDQEFKHHMMMHHDKRKE